jgi:plastocyanin
VHALAHVLRTIAVPAALACAVALASPPAAAARAAVEGTVTLPAAASEPVAKARYPVAASYAVGPPDPPAAIVYLEGAFAAPATTGAPPRAQVAQHHYQFVPGLLAVRRGTIVSFPNGDDEYHSVFSYSKAKRFDLGRYHKDETPAELTFDQPGLVKLYCEIHDHMRGAILVLDTPYFTKTDSTGSYRLENLPAGSYVLKAWMEDGAPRERPVELRDGATLRVDFSSP